MRSNSSKMSPFPWEEDSSKADNRKIITKVIEEDNICENTNQREQRDECGCLEVIIVRTEKQDVESSIKEQYKPRLMTEVENRNDCNKDYENNVEVCLEVDSSRTSPFPWDEYTSALKLKADSGNHKTNDKAIYEPSIITNVVEENRWENDNQNERREECEDCLEVVLLKSEHSEAIITSETTTTTTLVSSPEILRQVILSDFLTFKEMGRLLLLVSKSTTANGFLFDDVWKILLVNRFGADIAFEMMESLNCGPRRCFRHLLKVEQVKPVSLRFAPSDYRVIINVYDDLGNRIIFKIFNGEKLNDFFNNGFVELKGYDGLRKPVYAKYSGLFRMKATVHIVRVSDQKSLCIIDERKGLNEYSLEKRYFTFTTTTCPSSMRLWDDEYLHNAYFNLHMKIRKTKSREKCNDGCNVALYGSITLEALCYPTCELYRDYRDRNGGPKFSELLEMLYGWS